MLFSFRLQEYEREKGGTISAPLPGAKTLRIAGGFGEFSRDLETPRHLSPMTDITLIMTNTPAAALGMSGTISFILFEDIDDPDPNPELQPPKFSGGGR